jgi:Holliday junction resolvase RusA-like endonuclease
VTGVEQWTVIIPGTPRTQGSAALGVSASTGKPRGFKTAAEKAHRELAVALMRTRWRRRPIPKGTPVEVSIVASFPRPKKDYGSGRNANVLKPSAPSTPHAKTPDSDKIARLLLDALTIAKVIADDGQVAVLNVEKRWAPRDTKPWTRVTVRPVDVLTPRQENS